MDVHDSTIPLDDKAIARFWAKVDRSGGPTACWPWTASRSGSGYGAFWLVDKVERAHRVAYELTAGPIPGGKGHHGVCVCHSCDNCVCCNPAHLFLGTHADNMADRTAKGRSIGAAGDRNGSRLHPERLARGDQNGSRLYPERLSRGEANANAKLTEADIRTIRAALARGEAKVDIAARHGVGRALIRRIAQRKAWVHVKETADATA